MHITHNTEDYNKRLGTSDTIALAMSWVEWVSEGCGFCQKEHSVSRTMMAQANYKEEVLLAHKFHCWKEHSI